jgi:uncharacterized protein YukJ
MNSEDNEDKEELIYTYVQKNFVDETTKTEQLNYGYVYKSHNNGYAYEVRMKFCVYSFRPIFIQLSFTSGYF